MKGNMMHTIDFTLNELIVLRGAAAESIKVAMSVPNGTKTAVFEELRDAYEKLVLYLEGLNPSGPEHAVHKRILFEAART